MDSAVTVDTTNKIIPVPSSVLLTLMRCPNTATDTEKMNMLIELTRTSSTCHTKYFFTYSQAKELASKLELKGNRIAKYWTTSIYPMPCEFSWDGMSGCYVYCIHSKLKSKAPKTFQNWQAMMKLQACCDLNDDTCCEFATALISNIDSMSLTESNTCVICLNGKKEYACIPCGHKCICSKCKDNKSITACPLCRSNTTLICRIFD